MFPSYSLLKIRGLKEGKQRNRKYRITEPKDIGSHLNFTIMLTMHTFIQIKFEKNNCLYGYRDRKSHFNIDKE